MAGKPVSEAEVRRVEEAQERARLAETHGFRDTTDYAGTREFVTGAKRDADNGKPRLDYLPWRALRSLGAYMRESAERFGACNYRRGMPLSELNASMLRHAADYQTAHTQDEAVRALHGVLFNASVALEQVILGRDDLDDMDVIRDGARPDAEYHSVKIPPLPEPKIEHVTGTSGFGVRSITKKRNK